MGDTKSDTGLNADLHDIDIVVNPAGKKDAACLFCAAGIYRKSDLLGFIYYYSDKPISPDILISTEDSKVIVCKADNDRWIIDSALFSQKEKVKVCDELYWLPILQKKVECDIQDDDGFSYEVITDSFIDHTSTLREGHIDVPLFQNNFIFRIENTGLSEVSIIDININDKSWWTLEGLLRDAGVKGKDGITEEVIKKLWDFTRKNVSCGKTYQHLFKGDMKDISIIDFFNSLGTGACGTYSSLLALFCASCGIPARRLSLADGSHIITQALIGNRDFILDAFYGADKEGQGVRGSFFLNENREPASYDDLCHDHYLVNRSGRLRIGELASLFGYHDRPQKKWLSEYMDTGSMNIKLFAGESIEWRMHPQDSETGNPKRQTGTFYLSNNPESGRFIIPDTLTTNKDRVVSEHGGTLSCRISLPYPIYGITASLRLLCGNITIEIVAAKGMIYRKYSTDDLDNPVDISILPEDISSESLFDEQSRTVEINIISGSKTEFIIGGIEFLFHAYGKSLMSLNNGSNLCRLGFSDKAGAKKLSFTHQYLEFPKADLPVPEPPKITFENPLQDDNDVMAVMKFHTVFSGTPLCSGVIYDYIISDNPECIIPVAPLYQGLTNETDIKLSCSGLLDTDVVYYANARSINTAGVAGPWGKPVKFIPKVLPSPVWAKAEYLNDGIVLHWLPSVSLDGIVLYDIYGSREQGFRPSEDPYDVWIKRIDDPAVSAKYPSNYIGTSSAESYLVKYKDFPETGSFPAHFRIIPHTSHLTGSPGEMFSLKTPFIFSSSIMQTAMVNEPYSCFIEAVFSIGSLHFNRLPDKPMYTEFLNKEKPVYELIGNPPWITVRPYDGFISGTPASSDRGTCHFTVRCTTRNGTHSVEVSMDVI